MKFYLSSYKIGNDAAKLKELIGGNKKTAYISNALDFSNDLARRQESEGKDIVELKSWGLEAEIVDLREYFGKKADLENKLREYGAIWIRGGNVFVLRQAMRLSGFDDIMKTLANTDMLYGGFSAGVCVLGPTLKGLELVDDQNIKPYATASETIWEGLGMIDFIIVPHYKSEHSESEKMDEVIEYLIANNLPYKPLRDGEVIIIK